MIMGKFEDYYKRRLLPVADGIFDGVYSQRFKETNYKSVEGNAYLLLKILVKISFSLSGFNGIPY